jgi:hypothetical protein
MDCGKILHPAGWIDDVDDLGSKAKSDQRAISF